MCIEERWERASKQTSELERERSSELARERGHAHTRMRARERTMHVHMHMHVTPTPIHFAHIFLKVDSQLREELSLKLMRTSECMH